MIIAKKVNLFFAKPLLKFKMNAGEQKTPDLFESQLNLTAFLPS